MSRHEKLRALALRRLRRDPQSPTEFLVYCSGGIAKSTDGDQKLCWSEEEKGALQAGAEPASIVFLDPGDPLPELSDSAALFGRDMFQIQVADAVVVDARQRRGIGIGIEMLAARTLGAHLIAVVPPNSHYRREDLHFRGGSVAEYIHPHLASLSDAVVSDFEEAGQWLRSNGATPPKESAGEVIDTAIQAYRERLLARDSSMQGSRFREAPHRKRRLAIASWLSPRA
jgi:hypothetical protein